MENAKTTEVAQEKEFTLPNRKILVAPVRRKGGWLPPEHEGSFLFKHSYFRLVVPMDKRSGDLIDPLTLEERKFFESNKAGLALNEGDLLIHNKESKFWPEFTVKLDKHVTEFDLSKPMDYITYKVLLANTETIAPSAAEKFGKGSYKYAIVEEGYENETRVKAASSKKEAYRFFGKIDNSIEKMKNFLNVYNTQKPGGKSVPPNASQDFLIAEIEKIIEHDLETFLGLSRDKHYDKKILIYNALKAGALLRVGMTYKTPEEIIIGDNLQAVISFLDNSENNEEVIKIKTRIENSN